MGNEIEPERADEEISRRRFFTRVLFALNIAGFGGGLAGLLAYFTPPPASLRKVGGWKEVCKSSELGKGEAVTATYFGLPVFIKKVGDDIRAFSAICPHLGCIIKWDRDKRVFPCPCHESDFDLDGKVQGGPARPYNLLKYKVRVEEGSVKVNTPDEEDLLDYAKWFRFVIMSGG